MKRIELVDAHVALLGLVPRSWSGERLSQFLEELPIPHMEANYYVVGEGRGRRIMVESGELDGITPEDVEEYVNRGPIKLKLSSQMREIPINKEPIVLGEPAPELITREEFEKLKTKVEDLEDAVLKMMLEARTPEEAPKMSDLIRPFLAPVEATRVLPKILIAGGDSRVIDWIKPVAHRANFAFVHSAGTSRKGSTHIKVSDIPNADVAFVLIRFCGHDMSKAVKSKGLRSFAVPGARAGLVSAIERWLEGGLDVDK